jgi:hypothetical protein
MLILAILMATAPQATTSNPLIEELARCLLIREDAARLACSDVAGRRLVDASRDRDVVVVDRDQVRRTRRSLFGLNLGLADPVTGRDEAAERIETLDTTIQSARAERNNRWVLTLAESGRWATTEEWGGGGEPRAGAKVTVRRAALGSYVLKMEGVRAVRVQRVN